MKIPVFMQACPAAAHCESASGCLDPSCLQCAMASEHVAAEAGEVNRQAAKTAVVSVRMGANPGCVQSTHNSQKPRGCREISYFAGGRSGPSAHLRAAGSCSGSSP